MPEIRHRPSGRRENEAWPLTGIPLRHLGHSSYVRYRQVLAQRARLINVAITLITVTALLVALIAFLLEVRIAIAVLRISSW
jgi:hypothetical protein